LFLIAMMHIGGDDREKNAEVLNFGAKKELWIHIHAADHPSHLSMVHLASRLRATNFKIEINIYTQIGWK
jgi:hypothetical protein